MLIMFHVLRQMFIYINSYIIFNCVVSSVLRGCMDTKRTQRYAQIRLRTALLGRHSALYTGLRINRRVILLVVNKISTGFVEMFVEFSQ